MMVGVRPYFRDRVGNPTTSHEQRDDLHHKRDSRARFR
jgi:hypothetical protein